MVSLSMLPEQVSLIDTVDRGVLTLTRWTGNLAATAIPGHHRTTGTI
jgi:hypothetical protein